MPSVVLNIGAFAAYRGAATLINAFGKRKLKELSCRSIEKIATPLSDISIHGRRVTGI